jgi:hypothetical protein
MGLISRARCESEPAMERGADPLGTLPPAVHGCIELAAIEADVAQHAIIGARVSIGDASRRRNSVNTRAARVSASGQPRRAALSARY